VINPDCSSTPTVHHGDLPEPVRIVENDGSPCLPAVPNKPMPRVEHAFPKDRPPRIPFIAAGRQAVYLFRRGIAGAVSDPWTLNSEFAGETTDCASRDAKKDP
jgi:hypothetical protein